MQKLLPATVFLFLVVTYQAMAQNTDALRQKIQQLVAGKNLEVGVAIKGKTAKDTLTVNGNRQFPMQSVFKLHIGIVMLAEIDKGKYSLDQKIRITQAELLPGLYSPLREKYPQGAELPLSEILQYTVSSSDNVGCDVLLRLLGGPKTVESYFHRNKVTDLSIKINEEVMQANWDLQFQNWTTPLAANAVLSKFYYNQGKLLSPASHAFLWKIMKQTETGKDRLKGKLPPGTVVAHKTGFSGINKAGVTAAMNDIGVLFLPSGQPIFISVFVSNSKETTAVNEQVIADIAKATWAHFTTKAK
ncbi:class A beta-lactamase, subclass A2 [Rufibacter sp. LB8]|uniref:class A beta-lactamase, subclass A2 n=1 Tax=Rufibacter sp. LB8 TaxID=2777781 RepID=UPI00178C4C44|nr:class A beta-lactamase, subclass A2 [Rufibacter sp. LB8]